MVEGLAWRCSGRATRVGDGAGERPGRHVRLNLPQVLPVPFSADKPSLPQAQHLRVRAEKTREPRDAGLPVAHDKKTVGRPSRIGRRTHRFRPWRSPGPLLKLFGPQRPPGRSCFGFRREIGAEPTQQDLYAFEQVGSGIRALLGLALLYRETSIRRGAQRNDGARGIFMPLSTRRLCGRSR